MTIEADIAAIKAAGEALAETERSCPNTMPWVSRNDRILDQNANLVAAADADEDIVLILAAVNAIPASLRVVDRVNELEVDAEHLRNANIGFHHYRHCTPDVLCMRCERDQLRERVRVLEEIVGRGDWYADFNGQKFQMDYPKTRQYALDHGAVITYEIPPIQMEVAEAALASTPAMAKTHYCPQCHEVLHSGVCKPATEKEGA